MIGLSPVFRKFGPNRHRLVKSFLILSFGMLLIELTLTTGTTKLEGRESGAKTGSLLALQTGTPSGVLQRRTNPSTVPKSQEIECQRQHNQWDRNLPSRSLATGAAFYFISISVFTLLGFSTSFVRAFCAFIVAAISSPVVVGLQKREAFKVCSEPTNIYGILTADLFMWTLVGILLTALLLLIIRQFSAVRKLNSQ